MRLSKDIYAEKVVPLSDSLTVTARLHIRERSEFAPSSNTPPIPYAFETEHFFWQYNSCGAGMLLYYGLVPSFALTLNGEAIEYPDLDPEASALFNSAYVAIYNDLKNAATLPHGKSLRELFGSDLPPL